MINEFERLKKILATLDPTTEEYGRVLGHIENALYTASREHEVKFELGQPPLLTMPTTEADPWPEAKTIEVPKFVPKDPIIVKEPVEELVANPEITREYVRQLLIDCPGIKKEIITKYTPEGMPAKFSNIPESAYPDMVKELKANAQ